MNEKVRADLVKTKDPLIDQYENALLRRDNLLKEAENYHLKFIREFGDLMRRSFELKVECIKKKKMITFCQAQINRGKKIKSNELTAYIENEMQEYKKELDDLIRGIKLAKSGNPISELDVKKIKDIYYRLAKQIHPDMHPEYEGDEILEEFWLWIVIAYRHNDLSKLEELEARVNLYLEQLGTGAAVEIENIEERIEAVNKEIEMIITTNPYLYKILLSSDREIADKKAEYEEEIRAYERYSAELDDVLSMFEVDELLS